eukprot:scaffold322798_cov18-Tisochrysis_lutea.AAC.1
MICIHTSCRLTKQGNSLAIFHKRTALKRQCSGALNLMNSYAQNGFASPAMKNKPCTFVDSQQEKHLPLQAATLQPSIGAARLTNPYGASFLAKRL